MSTLSNFRVELLTVLLLSPWKAFSRTLLARLLDSDSPERKAARPVASAWD